MTTFNAYIVAVPHQRAAYVIADATYGDIDKNDLDLHDMHSYYEIDSESDEQDIIKRINATTGGQAFHQSATVYGIIMDKIEARAE